MHLRDTLYTIGVIKLGKYSIYRAFEEKTVL